MSSVSTAFKVHYNQKLGTHSAILGGGNAPWPLGGQTPLLEHTIFPLTEAVPDPEICQKHVCGRELPQIPQSGEEGDTPSPDLSPLGASMFAPSCRKSWRRPCFSLSPSCKIIIFYKEKDAASVPTGAGTLDCGTGGQGQGRLHRDGKRCHFIFACNSAKC